MRAVFGASMTVTTEERDLRYFARDLYKRSGQEPAVGEKPGDVTWVKAGEIELPGGTSYVAAITFGDSAILIDAEDWPAFEAAVSEAAQEIDGGGAREPSGPPKPATVTRVNNAHSMRNALWTAAQWRHSNEQMAGHNGAGFAACGVVACREATRVWREGQADAHTND